MENLSLENFNPTVVELQKLAQESAVITLENPEDQEQVKVVHDKRIELRDTRVAITKKGKELRDDANKFAKAVIVKEKELIAIIGTEEDRLEGLENQAKEIIARKIRLEAIPARQERLKELGITETDEELMKYDDDGFKTFVSAEIEKKNEEDRIKLQQERKKIEEDRLALEREKEMREREERVREEERQKAAKLAMEQEEWRIADEIRRKAQFEAEAKRKIEEAKEEAERIEREAKEKVEREERKQKEKEESEKKEIEEREKNEKYQAFLKENGYTEETKYNFIEKMEGERVILYKKIAEFNL